MQNNRTLLRAPLWAAEGHMKARLDRMRDHRKRVTSEESNALEDCTGEPRTGEPRLGHLLDTANQKAAPMQVPP